MRSINNQLNIYTIISTIEKLNLDETLKIEITVEAATVEDEVMRVRGYVAALKTTGKEPSGIKLPTGLDKTNPQEAERLTREEYDPNFYLAGLEKVQAIIPTIQEAVEKLGQFQQAWGFELSNSYKIILTRYGASGSYDFKNSNVFMRTDEEGVFKRQNPAATPIHEITHLCVEHLVRRFGLSFAEKERLVRGIDVTLFPEIFDPENKIQETERQSRLTTLESLPAALEQSKRK